MCHSPRSFLECVLQCVLQCVSKEGYRFETGVCLEVCVAVCVAVCGFKPVPLFYLMCNISLICNTNSEPKYIFDVYLFLMGTVALYKVCSTGLV